MTPRVMPGSFLFLYERLHTMFLDMKSNNAMAGQI